ncbi:DUF4190 domain-containing protein [Phycisphaeraceae bacterium D3-23]
MPDAEGQRGPQGDGRSGGKPGGGAGTGHTAPAADARSPGSAVASVVLGVAGVLTSFAVLPGAICGIAAAVLARQASNQTGPDSGRPGRGFAVAGQATGGLAILLSAVFGLVFVVMVWGNYNGGHRRGPHPNTTQLRGIHQGLVTFANSNKENFPGLDAKGNILANSAADTGMSGDGDTTEARFWILLTGNFFTPEYAISPSETENVTEYIEPTAPNIATAVEFNAGPGVKNYSYAMLSINGQPGQPPTAPGRSAEWLQSLNTQAIVMSDRNTGSNITTDINSIHSQTPGNWKGSVLWNDNHVAFEQSHYFETRYGSGAAFVDIGNGDADLDHVFALDNDPDGNAGNDAFMIHDGD